MPHVVLLSTDNLEEFFVYDELLIPYFEQHDWQVSTLSWHDNTIDWNQFDYVVVRSTWDYQQQADAFMACLERIDNSSATLLNPLSLIKWNIKKHYLRDLEKHNVTIVPTRWFSHFDEDEFLACFNEFNTDTLVVKPVLSANADDTFKLTVGHANEKMELLKGCFYKREFMVQPFMKNVIDEGEYSLFYFGGAYSHGILKVPKKGDFRVQEEHGGRLFSIDSDNDGFSQMCNVSEKALKAMPAQPLYARVDLVRLGDDWAVMELELIEPSLYFNLDNQSPERFVNAMLSYHQQTHN